MMNNIIKSLLIFGIGMFQLAVAFAQEDAKQSSFNQMVEKGMEDWQIPGLATVVVKDGEVVFQRTYGVKDLESQEPVDENTVFSMASTTKAVVAMALGILVDQGKLDWDDRVKDHLPSFELADPNVTNEARVKDLLTHNLGIPNADLLWILDNASTEETLKRFSKVQKTYPLRGGFVYHNIMYAIAGEVIEAVSGQHWSEFVDEQILRKLDMDRTFSRSKEVLQAGNYAVPFYKDPEEGIVRVDHLFSDQIGPAGMIWSNQTDVGKYLQFLVNGGVYQGDTLLQRATFDYLFQPQVILPEAMYPTQQLAKPNWSTYGLGWFQQDYRGKKLDFHTGSLPGLIAIAGIMRDESTAVYVFANMDHAELRHAMLYKAMDLWAFDDDSRDWHKEVYELHADLREKSQKQLKEREEKRAEGTEPSLPLESYTGTYGHDAWGTVRVEMDGDSLNLIFNDYLHKSTTHWHYDTFLTKKDPRNWSSYLVNFNLNAAGEVKELVFGEQVFRKEK